MEPTTDQPADPLMYHSPDEAIAITGLPPDEFTIHWRYIRSSGDEWSGTDERLAPNDVLAVMHRAGLPDKEDLVRRFPVTRVGLRRLLGIPLNYHYCLNWALEQHKPGNGAGTKVSLAGRRWNAKVAEAVRQYLRGRGVLIADHLGYITLGPLWPESARKGARQTSGRTPALSERMIPPPPGWATAGDIRDATGWGDDTLLPALAAGDPPQMYVPRSIHGGDTRQSALQPVEHYKVASVPGLSDRLREVRA